MLFIFRLIIVVIYCILVCIFGCIYCLFSPRNPKHVATFGHMFGRLSPVFGLKVEKRKPAGRKAMATPSISLTTRTTTIW
jgi:1-acyl-sn-glycerol-3-phosphate acyltransferase